MTTGHDYELLATEDGMYELRTERKLKDRIRVMVWTVDPTREYLPLRFSLTDTPNAEGKTLDFAGTENVWICSVNKYDGFVKTEAGLWFPTKKISEMILELPGQSGKREVMWRSVDSIEDLVLNADMPDEMFQFRFPGGTVVEDEVANLRYVVNTDSGGFRPRR